MLTGEVREREHVRPFPDDGTENNFDQSNLFFQLAPDRLLWSLARLKTTTGRSPKRPLGEFKMYEKHAVVDVKDECSNTFAKRQRHELTIKQWDGENNE